MSKSRIVNYDLLEKRSNETEQITRDLIKASRKTDMEYYIAMSALVGLSTVSTGIAMKFNAPYFPAEIEHLYNYIHDHNLLGYIKESLQVAHDKTSDNFIGNGLALLAAAGTSKVFSATKSLARSCIEMCSKLPQEHTHKIELSGDVQEEPIDKQRLYALKR
jgi:hypothetical protein